MKTKQWLKKVAFIGASTIKDDDGEIYYSNFDESYITRVGMEKGDGLLKFMAEHEITDELTHGVGFSPKESKWYGWSHRAIYGFEIGSTCKKGDCHYIGSNIDEQKAAAILFWDNDDYVNVKCKGIIEKDGDKFFDITWEYKDSTPNKKLHNSIGGVEHYITACGRGEWTAKTLEDAKLMAIDFNEGVS